MTPIKTLALAAALALTPLTAAAQSPMTAEEALALLFQSQDADGNGVLSPREVAEFRRLAYISLDTNADMMASSEEWLAWDPGFEPVARQIGRLEAFQTAKTELFTMHDANEDGFVSDAEMKAGFFDQFVKADADESGTLSPEEHAGFEIVARQLFVMR